MQSEGVHTSLLRGGRKGGKAKKGQQIDGGDAMATMVIPGDRGCDVEPNEPVVERVVGRMGRMPTM